MKEMKKTILSILLLVGLASFSYAEEIAIDRTGYHSGVGGSIVASDDDSETLPVLNLSLEYGLTPQSTIMLEHHGYIIAGFTALEYKYYMRESRDIFYWVGGIGTGHVLDYSDSDGILSKIGLGYAWGHLESDIFAIIDKDIVVSGLSLRYKF